MLHGNRLEGNHQQRTITQGKENGEGVIALPVSDLYPRQISALLVRIKAFVAHQFVDSQSQLGLWRCDFQAVGMGRTAIE